MERVGDYSWGSSVDGYSDFQFKYRYQLLMCPICRSVTLVQTYGDEEMIRPSYNGADDEYYEKDTILYPSNAIDGQSMPKNVKEAFESALKVKNVDSTACTLLLRRTLEIILKDQGATRWGLAEMIEEVAANGILPEALKEASFFAKKFGDSAAHGNELTADEHELNELIEFIEYIIEYLYIIPARIQQFKGKIEHREDKQHGQNEF
jgi:hypothetical protein